MKKSLASVLFLFSFFFLSAKSVVSDYTLQKVEDFVTFRVTLKSEEDEVAYKKILDLKEEALSSLKEHAIDYEQEECILETLYLIEYYEHALNSTGNQKELRDQIKNQMKKNVECIDKRKKNQINDWLYHFTGDVTAYYMTRSIAATLLYGMKVKGYYEKALEVNPESASPSVCLGNWYFYAPGLFGGGKAKAKKFFETALKNSKTGGEKYLSYIGYSQVNYELKNYDEAKKYLQMAFDLDLGRKDLDLIERCNEKGYSYFQYLRNRSGIDEEMAAEEKGEDD